MRVTKDMIGPQLRLPGRIASLLNGGNRTEEQIRAKDPFLLKLFAAIKPRGVDVQPRAIARDDGTLLHFLVCTRKGSTATNRPGILFIHGGGYSGGSARGELFGVKALLDDVDAVIVTPDYRLSVQAPYPAALDDSYLTLTWLQGHTGDLGVRSDQLIVTGGSAGGGLTAATTLAARDRGEVAIAFQMALCPMIDDRETASSADNNAPVYDGVTNRANWRIYLGDLYDTDNVPSTAAPAREIDYAGLPPTITMVGGVDPFRDETVSYAHNLAEAGVPVAFREFPGAWHGFEGIAAWTRIAKQATAWRSARFREYIDTYFAPQS